MEVIRTGRFIQEARIKPALSKHCPSNAPSPRQLEPQGFHLVARRVRVRFHGNRNGLGCHGRLIVPGMVTPRTVELGQYSPGTVKVV